MGLRVDLRVLRCLYLQLLHLLLNLLHRGRTCRLLWKWLWLLRRLLLQLTIRLLLRVLHEMGRVRWLLSVRLLGLMGLMVLLLRRQLVLCSCSCRVPVGGTVSRDRGSSATSWAVRRRRARSVDVVGRHGGHRVFTFIIDVVVAH